MNPTNYMYLDNRVLSRSVLFASLHILGWCMYLWL